MIDSLERRLFLAATAVFNSGVLTVTGTSAADQIRLDAVPGGFRTLVTVKSAGTTIYSTDGNSDVVTKILVNAQGGNDSITFSMDQCAAAVTINGGEGTDTIFGNFFESASFKVSGGEGGDKIQVSVGLQMGGKSVVHGSDGSDTIRVVNQAGESSPRVLGGAGSDVINLFADDPGGQYGIEGFTVAAGAGNDTVRGSAQEDLLMGEEGHDRIYGNGGDDLIFGGSGADILYGCVGDDFIDTGGDSNLDYTDGGDGDDTAIIGIGDDLKLFNVEDVLS